MIFYLVVAVLFTVYALDLLWLVVVSLVARSHEVATLMKVKRAAKLKSKTAAQKALQGGDQAAEIDLTGLDGELEPSSGSAETTSEMEGMSVVVEEEGITPAVLPPKPTPNRFLGARHPKVLIQVRKNILFAPTHRRLWLPFEGRFSSQKRNGWSVSAQKLKTRSVTHLCIQTWVCSSST